MAMTKAEYLKAYTLPSNVDAEELAIILENLEAFNQDLETGDKYAVAWDFITYMLNIFLSAQLADLMAYWEEYPEWQKMHFVPEMAGYSLEENDDDSAES